MLRAVPMMQLSTIILERDERAVLRRLGEMGVVHLTRGLPGPESAPLVRRDRKGELLCCDGIGTRVEELGRSLGIQLSSTRLPETDMTLDQAEERLGSMEELAAGPVERRRLLVQRLKQLEETCAQASSYLGFDIPADPDQEFSFFCLARGSVPAQNFQTLVTDAGDRILLFPLAEKNGRRPFLAITPRSHRPVLENLLERTGFQPDVFPGSVDVTVDRLCEESEEERKAVTAELESVNSRLSALSEELALPLLQIRGLAAVEHRLLEAGQRLPRTKTAVLLTGWTPADGVAAIEERIDGITGGCYVLKTARPDASADNEVPVLLRHSRFLRPFEVLVSTYGLPTYREVEPTIFVGLSYLIMFGLMFGDAGHGLVLALGGGFLLLSPAFAKARDFGFLLLFGGSSSILFGVVYGSYFGIESLKDYAFWHDPLEGDPTRLMLLTMGFGIIMISLGLVLNIVNRVRKRDFVGAFLDKFGLAGLFFYWGALVILTNKTFLASRGIVGLAIVLLLGLPMLGWAVKEPLAYVIARKSRGHGEPSEGMAAAIMESLVGTFEGVLSYLANTISFVRLAAYAMSHAALLVAAFMLAAQVKDLPFGGSPASIVVIILGNAVAIILEGIIASVQALRLEYYEFFGKFFSGGGQPFEPFRLAGKAGASAP